jgi:phosphatidyl-myo-inositol dimannoside synthase
MRVLALVTDAFGGFGGIAQYNRDFLTACAQSSPDVEILVLPRSGRASAQDLPANLTQLAPVSGRLAYVARALRTVAGQGPFDIIFCGHLFMALPAAILAWLSGARLWLQLHGIEAWSTPSRWLRWAAERADLVTAVSRHTRRQFLRWARSSPEKVKVLPNTVAARFHPGPKPRALIDRYCLKGKRLLLTVGRLSSTERYKGHDHVIAVLPELLKSYPDLVYLIAGDGDDRPRLEELATRYDVQHAVHFVGQIDHAELPDLYRLADVFVMPSTGEGFGIVFIEAAACGIPVIGGNRGGALDALRDGTLGQAIDPTAQNDLISALRTALDHPSGDTSGIEVFSYRNFAQAVARLCSLVASTVPSSQSPH